jgi:hypothetical protein
VRRLRAESGDGEVSLHLEGGGDLLLERWALERKGELFRREFDVKLKVTSDISKATLPGKKRLLRAIPSLTLPKKS